MTAPPIENVPDLAPVPRRSWLLLGLVLLAAAAELALVWPLTHREDCYITYRYAANLLAGHGAVYNPGERVEGFSSPLHLLLSAALTRVWRDPLWPANALSILAAIGMAAMVLRLTGSLAAAAVVALHPVTALNVNNGLETTLFSAAVVAVLYFAERRRFRASIACLAAVLLLRPEGAVPFAVLGLAWARRDGWKAAAGRLVPAAVPALAYLALRRAYYGDWLPNTYYAKVAGSDAWLSYGMGALDAGRFLAWNGGVLLAAAAVGVARRGRPLLPIVCGATILLLLLHLVRIGGGYEFGDRFYASIIPLAAIAAFRPARSAAGKALAAALAVAVLAPAAVHVALGHRAQAAVVLAEDLDGRDAGRALAAIEPDKDALVAVSAGQFPFFSGLRAQDYWGLTDRHIARRPMNYDLPMAGHLKFDGRYVLDRRPKYLTVTIVEGLLPRPPGPGDRLTLAPLPYQREMIRDERFWRDYRPMALPLPNGRYYVLFRRIADR